VTAARIVCSRVKRGMQVFYCGQLTVRVGFLYVAKKPHSVGLVG
jgi:hypothetical protein